MSLRLDTVPALAPRPVRPRGWLWLVILPLLLLLLGVVGTFVFGSQALRQDPVSFWGLAVGGPLLGWCLLSFGRTLLYLGQQQVADGWDKARHEDLSKKVGRGRRVQQVLSASLYTALRASGEQAAVQRSALLGGTRAIKAQPSRLGAGVLRHSRLPGVADDASEEGLLLVMEQVLCDLAQILMQLPDDTPLALLLEVDSALPENVLQRLWRQAWRESGIRQSTESVEGNGLGVVDRWLDYRIGDRAMLMVVAFQFAPPQPEGKGEAAVGLLFGNRLRQHSLRPMAYLHRPEQQRALTTDALLHAARQALDWVPLAAQSIEQAWRVGIDAQRDAALTTVLAEVPLATALGQGLCNADALLGDPGKASPWLAIAAATQNLQGGAGPQFIFSGGDGVDTGLWSTVLTPGPSLPQ